MSKLSMQWSSVKQLSDGLFGSAKSLKSFESEESEWSIVDPDSEEWTKPQKRKFDEDELACPTEYVQHSDSDLLRHPYYTYPAVLDPGIKSALLDPMPIVHYPKDGHQLYLTVCKEQNLCPVRLFYNNLSNREIDLSYYGVDPNGIAAMAKALSVNPFVQRFNLKDNFLNDDACYHLGQMLKTNTILEELNLEGCRIGYFGVTRLVVCLSVNKSLTEINLARNCLKDIGGEVFARALYYIPSLRRVNLSNNHLGRITAAEFTEFLTYRHFLTHLNVSQNNLAMNKPDLIRMLDRIGENEVLEEFDISWNAMGGLPVARALAKVFNNKNLRVLNISHNLFAGEPLQVITAGLIRAPKLNVLDLSNNPLTPEDALGVLKNMLHCEVKVKKVLLQNITVNKEFLVLLERVKSMPHRKKFKVIFGDVLSMNTITGTDHREVILKRAVYLGDTAKMKVDVIAYFLKLCEEIGGSMEVKTLFKKMTNDHVPLDADYVEQLSYIFPGPISGQNRSVKLSQLKEYIRRLWPDAKPLVIMPEKRSGKKKKSEENK